MAKLPPFGLFPTPRISFAGVSLTNTASSGSAAGSVTTSLVGGAWSISGGTPFAINSATGAITTTGAVTAGTYTPTVTYSVTSGGVTTQASRTVSILVESVSSGNMLFNTSSNSGLVAAVAF